jgi:hypothetical protein
MGHRRVHAVAVVEENDLLSTEPEQGRVQSHWRDVRIDQDGLDSFLIERLQDRSTFAKSALSAKHEQSVIVLASHKSDVMCQKLLFFQCRYGFFQHGILERRNLIAVHFNVSVRG